MTIPKVSPGAPLRIPARAYNAFVDAAADLKQRRSDVGAGSAGRVIESWLGYVVTYPTENDYEDERYYISRIRVNNDEGTVDDLLGFELADAEWPPPIPVAGGSGTGSGNEYMVTATNLAECMVSQMDAEAPLGTHLLVGGTAVRVWAVLDRQEPPVKHYIFWKEPFGTFFNVRCVVDGGTTDGDADNPCDRTYTVYGPDGNVLLTEATPEKPRPNLGQMDCDWLPPGPVVGTRGLAYLAKADNVAVVVLYDAGEVLVATGTGEEGKFQVKAVGTTEGATGNFTMVTDVRFNAAADQLEYKQRTITVVDGLITVIGDVGSWTMWAETYLCGGT